jgi:hypothetical protein
MPCTSSPSCATTHKVSVTELIRPKTKRPPFGVSLGQCAQVCSHDMWGVCLVWGCPNWMTLAEWACVCASRLAFERYSSHKQGQRYHPHTWLQTVRMSKDSPTMHIPWLHLPQPAQSDVMHLITLLCNFSQGSRHRYHQTYN